MSKFVFVTALLFWAPQAFAYTGPGLGVGVLGMLGAVIFSVGLAVLAFFWYPIKRFLKKEETTPEEETPKAS